MHIITWLNDETLDVVSTKYIQWPIVKMDYMAITEKHLGV